MPFFRKLLILLFLFPGGCRDEYNPDDTDLYGTWEAIHFISVESVHYSKTEDYNPQLSFIEDGSYGLGLDVNGCFGNYAVLDENRIEMTAPICTEICCDSDFSQKLAGMLSKVSRFEIHSPEVLYLFIDDWGFIKLEKTE